jgi:hypothetical protein
VAPAEQEDVGGRERLRHDDPVGLDAGDRAGLLEVAEEPVLDVRDVPGPVAEVLVGARLHPPADPPEHRLDGVLGAVVLAADKTLHLLVHRRVQEDEDLRLEDVRAGSAELLPGEGGDLA